VPRLLPQHLAWHCDAHALSHTDKSQLRAQVGFVGVYYKRKGNERLRGVSCSYSVHQKVFHSDDSSSPSSSSEAQVAISNPPFYDVDELLTQSRARVRQRSQMYMYTSARNRSRAPCVRARSARVFVYVRA
jgi:hypothetical protein